MKTDICIIGAGPVGIFSAFQAGMLGMKCVIIDALSFAGGQCSALYPEKPIYDIPSHKSITGQGLIDGLLKQAEVFSPKFILDSKATDLIEEDGGFKVRVAHKDGLESSVWAKAVIIAGGSGFFGPNRPPLSGIEKFEGDSILYFIDKMSRFEGKDVVIAGGGDSAVDWAISLAAIAKSVSIVHRRGDFRAMPESEKQLLELGNSGKIGIFTPYQLSGIVENNGVLSGVEIEGINDEGKRVINADYLLPFFGLKTDIGDIAKWDLAIEKKVISVDPSRMSTSRKGVYAVGDMCSYAGKLKLILCGFSEAAIAVHAAYADVFPDKPLHFEHSTSKKM
ncbi:NAD(P)/FAD-dependent oxidoreductase [Candidatus Deianiraea vastatrix]|uniref:Ferredoxin--NADP reductase n=1 Tax=Candidatus Deianiraea vastatrix TaxID=2163644 RepID=A0A5B8XEE8_9RICK|nr:NAD(P)/FAD-dependent oxidoreductase [Candidatus Deianiraea vastatrix]QED23692.1 Ferredoxin--NADP reductase [Candidatus Deianiraea vastatrix]